MDRPFDSASGTASLIVPIDIGVGSAWHHASVTLPDLWYRPSPWQIIHERGSLRLLHVVPVPVPDNESTHDPRDLNVFDALHLMLSFRSLA